MEYHRTYLDTVGRPVVVATKENLVEQHIVDFEVTTRGGQDLIRGGQTKRHYYCILDLSLDRCWG